MLSGIAADSIQISEEELRRRRAASVGSVKRTNGRISLEQRVREAWEDDGQQRQDCAARRGRGASGQRRA